MATLVNASVYQLAKARDAYAKFKQLATVNGINFARVYTSYNTRTNKVRVKVYAVGSYSKHMAKVNKLGFEVLQGNRFDGYNSLVAYF